MSVLWAGGPPEGYPELDASFIHDLQQASQYGGTVLTNVSLKPDFVPLSRTEGQDCILLLLSSSEPAKECRVVQVWNR